MRTRNRTIKIVEGFVPLFAALWLAHGAHAATFTVNGSQEIGGATPQIVGDIDATSITNTAVGSGTPPPGQMDYTFTWNGVDRVDLAGATLTYTRVSPSDRGLVTLDCNGASLVSEVAGAPQDGLALETKFVTQGTDPAKNTDRYKRSDHLALINLGGLRLGGISTAADLTPDSYAYPYGGNLTIGSNLAPCPGAIRVAYLHTFGGKYGVAAAGSGPGNVSIFGLGAVIVADNADNAGDILAWSSRGSAAMVAIQHVGDFLAGDIDVSIFGGGGGVNLGVITLDGGNSAGDLMCQALRANYLGGNYPDGGPAAITIRNYRNVHIAGNVEAWNDRTKFYDHRRDGGNVICEENIEGDIAIDGQIDLRTENNSAASLHGTLRLAAAGDITLATLDLSKMLYAKLTAGGRAAIAGAITGTDGVALAGAGGVLANGGEVLRLSAGKKLYYTPAENPALHGGSYTLADLDGNAGAGGLLQPVAAMGTVILLR